METLEILCSALVWREEEQALDLKWEKQSRHQRQLTPVGSSVPSGWVPTTTSCKTEAKSCLRAGERLGALVGAGTFSAGGCQPWHSTSACSRALCCSEAGFLPPPSPGRVVQQDSLACFMSRPRSSCPNHHDWVRNGKRFGGARSI